MQASTVVHAFVEKFFEKLPVVHQSAQIHSKCILNYGKYFPEIPLSNWPFASAKMSE